MAGRKGRHALQSYWRTLKVNVEDLLKTQELCVVDLDFDFVSNGRTVDTLKSTTKSERFMLSSGIIFSLRCKGGELLF